MRLLIQSLATGQFLVPSMEGGEPMWVSSLREAGGGVFTDIEMAHQLFEDNVDFDHGAVLVDLDRIGTANDYV